MNKVTYNFQEWHDDDSEDNVELSFTVDKDNMNCYRFHDYCKRFAAAMGYLPSTIEKVFGPTHYNEMFG